MDPVVIAGIVVLVLVCLLALWAWVTIKIWIRGVKLMFRVLSVLVLLAGLGLLAAAIAYAATVL